MNSRQRSRFHSLATAVTLVVASAFLGFAPTSHATPIEMVVNGEFELPGPVGPTFVQIQNADIPGWSCSQGSCEIWGQGFNVAPPSGSDGVLTGNHHEITLGSGIQTTTQAILIGASAAIADFSFDMWPRMGSGVNWSVIGSLSGLLSSGTVTASGSNVWINTSVTGLVLTPSETISLSFESVSGSGSGEHIDGVSLLVTAVPEPATLALLSLGLVGLGFRIKRKQLH